MTTWIPVTEAMPVDDRWVLTFEIGVNGGPPTEVARYRSEGGFWTATDGFVLECVTHWQPLPELPLTTDPNHATMEPVQNSAPDERDGDLLG